MPTELKMRTRQPALATCTEILNRFAYSIPGQLIHMNLDIPPQLPRTISASIVGILQLAPLAAPFAAGAQHFPRAPPI